MEVLKVVPLDEATLDRFNKLKATQTELLQVLERSIKQASIGKKAAKQEMMDFYESLKAQYTTDLKRAEWQGQLVLEIKDGCLVVMEGY